ncbi:helix-turn-helix domain-containing protein [Enterococcus raffinosus]|uniref:helix-turn-helix domain-containing protein n=1 Tax=Enterococcus raffinosus TaxID=71452 RepID=UPI0036F440E9
MKNTTILLHWCIFLSISNVQRYLKELKVFLNCLRINLCSRTLRLEDEECLIRHFYYL